MPGNTFTAPLTSVTYYLNDPFPSIEMKQKKQITIKNLI
jgi:hypothetical protein